MTLPARISTRSPRSAYVHVPFCRHRCGYCNFTLVAGRDDLIDDYLKAIEMELTSLDEPRSVDTLFLGGGTPTHLPADKLEQLLHGVRRWFRLRQGYEFSVEANPVDLSPNCVDVLRHHGVTRISIGAQSFSAHKLMLLERDHDHEQIQKAVQLARERFVSVSLDLIFAVPNESLSDWESDLNRALALTPNHLSTYGLTFERGTPFWSRQQKHLLTPLPDELQATMYLRAIERLTDAGFEHYEVSNFALPGHRCRHNETYWLNKPYYAVGPGAARYIDGRRETNHRSTTTYLKRVLGGHSPVAESEQLQPEERAREQLVFGLRRLQGVNRGQFQRETGIGIEQLAGDYIDQLVQSGMLRWAGENLALTRRGLLVSDSIWPRILQP